MKPNYTLKLFIVVVLSSFLGSVSALTLELIPTTIITVKSDNTWQEIKTENGIKTSYTKHNVKGISYLKVKFENLTNQDIQFNWTLSNKKGDVLIKDESSRVKSNSFVEFISTTKLVLIKKSEDLQDFPISINLQSPLN